MEEFKFFEHTADLKFQAYGKSLKEVFENSARALIHAIYSKAKKPKKKIILAHGKDLENLMYNFLEEFLFLLDAKEFVCADLKILKFDENKKTIKAEVYGDSVGNYQNKGVDHIKAITYNSMFIKKQKTKWTAQVVLDV